MEERTGNSSGIAAKKDDHAISLNMIIISDAKFPNLWYNLLVYELVLLTVNMLILRKIYHIVDYMSSKM